MPTGHGTSERHAGLAGVRKPAEKGTAGEVRRAVPRSAYQPAPEAGFLFSLGVMARRLLTAAELFYFVPTFAAEPTGSLKCA